MADKKVAITCQDFKVRRQDGNGFKQGKVTDVPGLQEIELELEQGNEPVYADGVKKLNLFSGITGATLTANLMELTKEERTEFLGVKVNKGMELYTADQVPPYVSVSWKYKCNDGSYIYYGLTRGNFNLPGTSSSTMEDSPEQQDQVEMEGSFMQRDKDKLVFARIHSADPEFDEKAFYEAIHGTDSGSFSGAEDVKVSKVTIEPSSAEVDVDSTVQLTATVEPKEAKNNKVGFFSENEDIATVDRETGLVTGVSQGEAQIRAVAEDGSRVYGTATITVNDNDLEV
ncbi:major tail protein [Staphylococcus agnetis]|uniref:major tail protein n=1 Tax=Staphylococcus agnetis TaxID=985762 RepID=UPI00076188A3|nr:major tail protein [Staphylococcus agnetis]NJI12025.1 hypothetical protein [Staphylococcus agnetis]QJQ71831.1 hypothetical protein EP23_12390 [Staphylococcus agnetis]